MRVVTLSFQSPTLETLANIGATVILLFLCTIVYLEASGRVEEYDGDFAGGMAGWIELVTPDKPKELCTRSTVCI